MQLNERGVVSLVAWPEAAGEVAEDRGPKAKPSHRRRINGSWEGDPSFTGHVREYCYHQFWHRHDRANMTASWRPLRVCSCREDGAVEAIFCAPWQLAGLQQRIVVHSLGWHRSAAAPCSRGWCGWCPSSPFRRVHLTQSGLAAASRGEGRRRASSPRAAAGVGRSRQLGALALRCQYASRDRAMRCRPVVGQQRFGASMFSRSGGGQHDHASLSRPSGTATCREAARTGILRKLAADHVGRGLATEFHSAVDVKSVRRRVRVRGERLTAKRCGAPPKRRGGPARCWPGSTRTASGMAARARRGR